MPCVTDRVLGQVLADDPDHPGPQRHGRVAGDAEGHSGTCSRVGEPLDHVVEDRPRLGRRQRDDLAAALQLGEEKDLVDQLPGALDFGAGLVDQLVHVGVGEGRTVE